MHYQKSGRVQTHWIPHTQALLSDNMRVFGDRAQSTQILVRVVFEAVLHLPRPRVRVNTRGFYPSIRKCLRSTLRDLPGPCSPAYRWLNTDSAVVSVLHARCSNPPYLLLYSYYHGVHGVVYMAAGHHSIGASQHCIMHFISSRRVRSDQLMDD